MRVAVGLARSFAIVVLQVAHMHGDHRCLLFFNVKELDQAFFKCIVKIHSLSLLETMNVAFTHKNLVVFDNEERTLHTASIRVESDLLVSDIPHDRDLFRNLEGAPKVLDTLQQVVRVVVRSKPVSVDEDFYILPGPDHGLVPLLEFLDTEVLEDRNKATDGATHRYEGHQSEVLDQATTCAFRCLCWTDHAPVGIVELARLR